MVFLVLVFGLICLFLVSYCIFGFIEGIANGAVNRSIASVIIGLAGIASVVLSIVCVVKRI